MRRGLLALVTVLVAFTVALALVEVGIRIFAPQPTKLSVSALLDSRLIYRLPPNTSGTDVKEEFAVHIQTNAQGLRDRDYSLRKPAGVATRVLVLGDSMTFAEGVESADTFPEVVERRLSSNMEVINAAIRGYGPDQELLLFDELVPIYRPDVAVLAVYVENDYEDVLYGHLFEARGAELVPVPLSEDSSQKYRYYRQQSRIQGLPGYQFLVAHSHTMNLVRRWWGWREFHQVFPQYEADHQREEQAWSVLRLVLTRWIERARAEQIEPRWLLLPAAGDVGLAAGPKNAQRTEQVLKLAKDLGVIALDLRPAMKKSAAAGDVLYYPKDQHFTVAGHHVVAEQFESMLREMMPH